MNEQEKREKVVEGLGKVLNDIMDGYITNPNAACNFIAEAIALLKKQEPRVIVLDEVKTAIAVYIERRGFPIDDELSLLAPATHNCNFVVVLNFMYDDGQIEYAKDYNITWRCWTYRPTDAQREATPWE